MKKILIVFGTRPEAIKMAPIVNELKKIDSFESKVCVTAQHREMLDQVLNFFNIIPDYDLNLMKSNQSLNQLCANILLSFDTVLDSYTPELVLVHGDTSTSSMCAFAAFQKGIKVGHVEAGLRTYDKRAPFPEELNRQITGRIADYHFAPTDRAAKNLLNENVDERTIFITGNTVIDALFWGLDRINEERKEIKKIKRFLNQSKKLIIVTGHRRENFGVKFKLFCEALKIINTREDLQIIYPVHLNPNVFNIVHKELGNCKNILLLNPLDYEVFIWLLYKSDIIITDSGGIQEEAPSLKKPVLVTRDVTERQEVVDSGAVKLVGTNTESIVNNVFLLIENKDAYNAMIQNVNPFGDGTAASKIAKILKSI